MYEKSEKRVWQPTTIWPPGRPHGQTKVIEVSNGTLLTFGREVFEGNWL